MAAAIPLMVGSVLPNSFSGRSATTTSVYLQEDPNGKVVGQIRVLLDTTLEFPELPEVNM